MGDVGVALSPDANSMFYNLAKLPFAKDDNGLAVTYTPWLKELVNDVFLATVSGYKKLDDKQAFGASLRYFDLGNVQFTDISGENQGNFHPREFAVDGGYARKLSDNWSLGVALRYIYSNLASGANSQGVTFKPGQSVAGDLSVFYTKKTDYAEDQSGTWNAGAALTNMGSKISYSDNAQYKNFIPTNLALGGAYTRQFDQYNQLTFELDINKLLVPTPPNPSDSAAWNTYNNESPISGMFHSFGDAPGGFSEELQELMYSFGLEYWYNQQFALRAGYFNENKNKGDRKYFTVGLGLKYEKFNLNFSYLVPSGNGIQRNPLSNTLRFSLLYAFGNAQAN